MKKWDVEGALKSNVVVGVALLGVLGIYGGIMWSFNDAGEVDGKVTGPGEVRERNYERSIREIPELEFEHYKIDRAQLIGNELVYFGGKDVAVDPDWLTDYKISQQEPEEGEEGSEGEGQDDGGTDKKEEPVEGEEPKEGETPKEKPKEDEEPETPKEDDTEEKIVKKEVVTETLTEVKKTNGFDVEDDWVYAVIDKGSAYDQNKETNNDNGTVSHGLMQVTDATFKELAEKVFKEDVPADKKAIGVNVKYGMGYLDFLKDINDNLDFVFTAYAFGPVGAEMHKQETGSYESEYSKWMKEKLSETKTADKEEEGSE